MKLLQTIQLACGQTYVVETPDGQLLELGDVFMSREEGLGTRPYKFSDFKNPSDTNKRVMTICTMAGCMMHCRFCASRRSFKRLLTVHELIGQVDFMIEEGKKHGRNSDPNNASEFRVLYTRMGEPMLNAKNVIDAMKILLKRYPHMNIGLSTSGIYKGVMELLKHPEILGSIDMQFSVHATNDKDREYLFDVGVGSTIMSLPQIAVFSHEWFRITNKPVCLNMILFEGYTYNFSSLLSLFNPKEIWIRLSPWNEVKSSKKEYNFEGLLETDDVMSKKPVSSKTLQSIIDDIQSSGIPYAYAPAIDEEIKHHVACGQALESFCGTDS